MMILKYYNLIILRKKKNMSKVKGVLKQIVDDDRNIKKKFMKTSRKRNNRKVKDW